MLKSHEGAFVCYQDGVTRVTVKRSAAETEDSLKTDGLAALWYAGYTFTGSVSVSNLFTTNYTEVTNTWAVSDSSIFKIAMVRPSEGELVDGLRAFSARFLQMLHWPTIFGSKAYRTNEYEKMAIYRSFRFACSGLRAREIGK